MSSKPVAEDLVLRVRPPAPRWRWPVVGPAVKAAGLGLISACALFLVFLAFQEKGPGARRGLDLPPPARLDAAIASAQERLKVDPQDLRALVELGMLHFKNGKESYAEAINELEEARDLGALDARIFYCLGVMYQEVGLYPFALAEYRRYLRHSPQDKEIRMLSAKLLYRQGDYAEAVSEYERLKYHHPKDPLIEENLALSLWGGKAMDRAVESFRLLAQAPGPQGRRAEYYLGAILLEQNRSREALEHLLRSLPQDASSAQAIAPEKIHAAMALAYQRTDQLEWARQAWQKALACAPGDAKALAALRDINRRISSRKSATAKKK